MAHTRDDPRLYISGHLRGLLRGTPEADVAALIRMLDSVRIEIED